MSISSCNTLMAARRAGKLLRVPIPDPPPYITERIKRFGEYATDGLTDPPAAFDPHLELTTAAAGERTETVQTASARRAA